VTTSTAEPILAIQSRSQARPGGDQNARAIRASAHFQQIPVPWISQRLAAGGGSTRPHRKQAREEPFRDGADPFERPEIGCPFRLDLIGKVEGAPVGQAPEARQVDTWTAPGVVSI
jgi:hypothetical protein